MSCSRAQGSDAALGSRVKHSTTEPLRSLFNSNFATSKFREFMSPAIIVYYLNEIMTKTSVKFQKNRHKTVGGVAHTRYPVSINFDSKNAKKCLS